MSERACSLHILCVSDSCYKRFFTVNYFVGGASSSSIYCCLPTPLNLASGGNLIFQSVVHQPASPSIFPVVQSFRRGMSTNPGVTLWAKLKR